MTVPAILYIPVASGNMTTLPIAIDYLAALALRQMALVQDELPKYLLAPEVSALLHYVLDLHRKMLLQPSGTRGRTSTRRLPCGGVIFPWSRPGRSCSWLHSSRVRREPPEQQGVHRPAARRIAWYRFQITSKSASCR